MTTTVLAVLSVPFALLVGASAILAIRAAMGAAKRRPPVPGNATLPSVALPPPPPPARLHPAPGRARDNYRAPTGENLGTCHTTIHLHDSGTAVILDHVRRRRIVCHPFPGDTDEAFLAHLEREVWDT